ncbi:DUF2927 domain-containing protein [Aeromonas schubertii]|uniref:DUF2927 domain-containing protein n=1 Tax=Aeromonas TaxID=642 RepID=UPI00067F0177|nr:DUF2927 domain-containing protein [Aeromonas schubertii]KUE79116.1 hypothetical protein ATO46_07405 [Aeromonas schubertii]
MHPLAWLLLLFAPLLWAAEPWQRTDYLTSSFLEIALRREYSPGKKLPLSRWEKPIRYHLINESGDRPLQTELVRVQMSHLSHITGVKATRVAARQEANLVIVMTRQSALEGWAHTLIGKSEELPAALADGLCLGNFTTRGGAIDTAAVLIPTDRARDKGKFLDCVVEELTQVMGLPNDSDRVFPSIFNDHSVDHFITPLDYLLLRILYAPELKSGMHREDVAATLPTIVTRLAREGAINQAPRLARAGSLREWAGL